MSNEKGKQHSPKGAENNAAKNSISKITSQNSDNTVILECIDGMTTLDRAKHSILPVKKLPAAGVYYSIDDSDKGLDRINFHIDPTQSSITVETVIDAVDLDDGALHQRLLDFLSNLTSVQVTDNGIMKESVYKELQESVKNTDNSIPFSVHRYGPIWISLNIGTPNTVGELIKIVDDFRNEVYNNM